MIVNALISRDKPEDLELFVGVDAIYFAISSSVGGKFAYKDEDGHFQVVHNAQQLVMAVEVAEGNLGIFVQGDEADLPPKYRILTKKVNE